MHDHIVIVGFGITGTSAARALLRIGTEPNELTIVDRQSGLIDQARKLGIRGIVGDCTTRRVLERAIGGGARCVIITVQPDETAVLITMLAHDLCPEATVLTTLRDSEHMAHARRVGADQAIAISDLTGKALANSLTVSESSAGFRLDSSRNR